MARPSRERRGIAADALPLIFNRFGRTEDPASRRHGGLGLGLTIVRHLVELHGGTVRAESAGPGYGAAFTVDLPLDGAPSGLPVSDDTRATSPGDRPTLDGLRILVVEDDGEMRQLLQAMLTDYGAVVHVAGSAREALATLDHRPPDVLVSDVGLPGEDGYALMRELRLRSSARGGAIPAIALTAFASVADRRNALDAGYDLHVAKPIDPALLGRAIADLAHWADTREDG